MLLEDDETLVDALGQPLCARKLLMHELKTHGIDTVKAFMEQKDWSSIFQIGARKSARYKFEKEWTANTVQIAIRKLKQIQEIRRANDAHFGNPYVIEQYIPVEYRVYHDSTTPSSLSLTTLEDDETLRTKKGTLLKKRTDILKILKQANIKTVQDFMIVKDWNDKRFEHMLRWMKQLCQETQKETNDRETAKATLEWQRIQRANG